MQRRVTIDLDDLDDVTLSVVTSVDGVPLRRVVEKAIANYLAGRRRYPPIERAVRNAMQARGHHPTARADLTARNYNHTMSGVHGRDALRPVGPAEAGQRYANGPADNGRNEL